MHTACLHIVIARQQTTRWRHLQQLHTPALVDSSVPSLLRKANFIVEAPTTALDINGSVIVDN